MLNVNIRNNSMHDIIIEHLFYTYAGKKASLPFQVFLQPNTLIKPYNVKLLRLNFAFAQVQFLEGQTQMKYTIVNNSKQLAEIIKTNILKNYKEGSIFKKAMFI